MKSSNEDRIYSDSNRRENREGLRAWLNPTRYGWERISYWLQRLTGVFLLIYFIGHVIETRLFSRWQRCLERHVGIDADYMGAFISDFGNWNKYFPRCQWDPIVIYRSR